MAAVLIPEHLDPKQNDVGPWGQIVFDIFQDPSDKEFYNGIVNDQQALVDLIKNSGITLTMPTNFLTTEIMTYDELKKKMPQILKRTVVHRAITIPIALTPSLWKRTRTGAVQMWQGIGVATASPSDWENILKRTSTAYAGNSEFIGEIMDGMHSPSAPNNVVIELIGFHGQQGSSKMQVKDPTEIVAKGNRTKYRQLTNELNSKYVKKLNRSNYEIGKPVVAKAGAFQMPIVSKVTPMLAKNFSKGEGKRIVYPCVVQRKFDGVRCLCNISEGKVKFYSRKGVEYHWLNKSKISTEILSMFNTPVALAKNMSGRLAALPNSTYSPNLIKGVTNTKEQLDKDHTSYKIAFIMLEQIMKDGWWLDGELYSHELSFDRISGLARKKNRTQAEDEDTLKLGYRVYDFFSAPSEDFYQVAHDNGYTGDPEDILTDYKLAAIDHKSPYKIRYGLLALIYRLHQMDKVTAAADKSEIIKSLTTSAVELTENIYVLREDQLEEIHDLFVDEGYEGLMLRNLDMPYEFTRSWNLVKYKVMKDDEFKIVDAVQGLKGKQKGAIIWICETPQGDRFNVVPNGTMASRKILWDEWKADPKAFIGKELTVQYQELTPKGIPRFPKGIAIRDYE